MKREKFIVTPAYDKFLTKLRLARQEKGVSQRELARRVGVHWSRVIRSESGERPLDVTEVIAYCKALQIPVVEFTRELDAALNAMEAEAGNATTSTGETDAVDVEADEDTASDGVSEADEGVEEIVDDSDSDAEFTEDEPLAGEDATSDADDAESDFADDE